MKGSRMIDATHVPTTGRVQLALNVTDIDLAVVDARILEDSQRNRSVGVADEDQSLLAPALHCQDRLGDLPRVV